MPSVGVRVRFCAGGGGCGGGGASGKAIARERARFIRVPAVPDAGAAVVVTVLVGGDCVCVCVCEVGDVRGAMGTAPLDRGADAIPAEDETGAGVGVARIRVRVSGATGPSASRRSCGTFGIDVAWGDDNIRCDAPGCTAGAGSVAGAGAGVGSASVCAADADCNWCISGDALMADDVGGCAPGN